MADVSELPPQVIEAIRCRIESLPPLEQQVINGLYYERLGKKSLAKRMDLEPRSVARIRDRALVHLGHLLDIED